MVVTVVAGRTSTKEGHGVKSQQQQLLVSVTPNNNNHTGNNGPFPFS
jgi:hypothetical protein